MSEVKVNKISPRTACGTVTMGDSGDAFTIPSGVTITNNGTQVGFGRTGTVDWVTTPKVTGDSPITAVTGKGYFLNTTAGAITINLPAGAAGSIVSMADYAATWNSNNVTVVADGSEKIGGIAQDAVLSTEGQSVTFVYVDSTQGWLNTMDSTSNVRGAIPFMTATVSGACNTLTTAPDCANVKLAKFVGPGTFCVSAAASCAAKNVVSYVVVASGGGGGGTHGGGGGAGGFREYKGPLTPYTASPLDGNPGGTEITVSATAYPITVGGGGAGAPYPVTPDYTGSPGNPSIFSSITSTAGGGGGGGGGVGKDGGSGSGGGNFGPTPTTPTSLGGSGNTPSVSPAQGMDGGNGDTAGGTGGGGGATVAGTSSGAANTGSNGGNGATTSISATPTVYAGGGGGGASAGSLGCGGTGGGGDGSITPGPGGPGSAGTGTVNTGGGGGGGGSSGGGGAGGSGIVYLRYKFQ